MSLLDLPDELILQIFDSLHISDHFNAQSPGSECFSNDTSNVKIVLSDKDKYHDIQSILVTCTKLRRLMLFYLRKQSHLELQLSMARSHEYPTLSEFKKFKTCNPLVPVLDYKLSIFQYVSNLEICLNFIETPIGWNKISTMFHHITCFKILGNTENYFPIFEYNDDFGSFPNLQKLSLPLPNSVEIMSKLLRCFPFEKLTHLTLFMDPYGNFTLENIEGVMKLLRNKLFNSQNGLKDLNLIAANDLLYDNAIWSKQVAFLISGLEDLSSISILHKSMRLPSFSTYVELAQYPDYPGPNAEIIESILRNVKLLKRLTLDMKVLRKLTKPISQIFDRLEFYSTDSLELVLVEPAFLFPLSHEQVSLVLKLILLTQLTSFSFKFGIQSGLSLVNYGELFAVQLVTALCKKFNYRRLKHTDYELCWSVIEDSYVIEYNDAHPHEQLLSWQRPGMASSIYKETLGFSIKYLPGDYETPDASRTVWLSRGEQIHFMANDYKRFHLGNDEYSRLKFWRVMTALNDYVHFNSLGNRKGSIFD